MRLLFSTLALAMFTFGIAVAQTDAPKGTIEDLNSVDVMPTFQDGGVENFCYWVMTNVAYPTEAVEAGIEGMVLVKFVINTDGKIGDYEVIQAPATSLSEAVIATLDKANELESSWTPGLVDGEPVRVSFTIPVKFAMQ